MDRSEVRGPGNSYRWPMKEKSDDLTCGRGWVSKLCWYGTIQLIFLNYSNVKSRVVVKHNRGLPCDHLLKGRGPGNTVTRRPTIGGKATRSFFFPRVWNRTACEGRWRTLDLTTGRHYNSPIVEICYYRSSRPNSRWARECGAQKTNAVVKYEKICTVFYNISKFNRCTQI